MAQMAQELYGRTNPLRWNMIYDLENFIRPGQASTYLGNNQYSFPQGTGGGGVSTINPTSPAASTTAMPSYGDIRNALDKLASPSEYSQSWPMLSQYVDPRPLQNEVWDMLSGSGNIAIDQLSKVPEFKTWADNKAAELSITAMQKAIPQGGTSGTTNQQSTAPAGFTSSGLYNPYNLPGYAPLYQLARTGLESQYNPARQSIMESTPRGGALYENLANLEMSRAQQAGSLPATIAAPLISDLYNKAYGVAFNSPQQSMAGLGAATSSYNQLQGLTAQGQMQQAALANQNSLAGSAGLGSLAALGLGGLGGKGSGGKGAFSGASATGGLSFI
jgi:hypothetical protein